MEAREQNLIAAYAQEIRDPKWSLSAVHALNQAYSVVSGLASLTISSDCRSTLCRVDFSYSDTSDGLTSVRSLIEARPWPGVQFTRLNRETQEGFTFIAREGFELPNADPTTITR